ncbi:MAG: fatty acid desaturase [Myxococcota bacterium]
MNYSNSSTASARTGVVLGLGIIVAWFAGVTLGLSAPIHGPESLIWVLPLAAVQTFLSTGLFITAHDAMHGTVAPRHRVLNDAIGTLSVTLYALFSFSKLRHHHGFHHGHPGDSEQDPDFHDGNHPGFIRWYLRFMFRYLTIAQVLGMALVFNLLNHGWGIPVANLLLLWVLPSLLSTFQLFYFGTYLPHRAPNDDADPHHAQSSSFPVWLSLLTCYHFGYHREHHEHPAVPWWQLPAIRWPSRSVQRSSP